MKIVILSFLLLGAVTIMKLYPQLVEKKNSLLCPQNSRGKEDVLILLSGQKKKVDFEVSKGCYFLIGSSVESSKKNPHSTFKAIEIEIYTNLPKGYPYKFSIYRRLIPKTHKKGDPLKSMMPIAADFYFKDMVVPRPADFVIGKYEGRVNEKGLVSGYIYPMAYEIQTLHHFDNDVLERYSIEDKENFIVLFSGDSEKFKGDKYPYVDFEFKVRSILVGPAE